MKEGEKNEKINKSISLASNECNCVRRLFTKL